MKTVLKDLSSEDEGRHIFSQNHRNYPHRRINSWQKKSLPICRFSGCKKSSRLRDTEGWMDLMNLITCLVCGPCGELEFLLKQIFTVSMRRWLDLAACWWVVDDCSCWWVILYSSLLNSAKPMVQCTNKRLEYLLAKIPSRRGELSERDPYRQEYELCHLGFLLGACVLLFSRSKLWSIQIEEPIFSW